MKKFFIMAVMAVCSLAANAQSPAAGSFTVTPKIGANFANLADSDDKEPFNTRIGLAVGAEALYMFNDMLGISGGVIYSQQGAKPEHGTTYKLDYINVPIMINEYVYPGLAIKLGVQPGFKINEEMSAMDVSVKSEGVESLDISIPVGISYEFNKIVVDARYNWGVSDIFKSEYLKAKNSVFQVTLGYRF